MPDAVVIAFSAGPSTSSVTSRLLARQVDDRLTEPGVDQRVEHHRPADRPASSSAFCQLLLGLHAGVPDQPISTSSN